VRHLIAPHDVAERPRLEVDERRQPERHVSRNVPGQVDPQELAIGGLRRERLLGLEALIALIGVEQARANASARGARHPRSIAPRSLHAARQSGARRYDHRTPPLEPPR
jgi:hypothetical protein